MSEKINQNNEEETPEQNEITNQLREVANKEAETDSIETEKSKSVERKLKRTRKVIQKLVLWGTVAISPFMATETSKQDINVFNPLIVEKTDDIVGKDMQSEMLDSANDNRDDVEKVFAFEARFKEEGFLAIEKKHDKPVITFISIEDINAIKPGYSYQDKYSKVLSQDTTIPFVRNEKFKVVTRDGHDLRSIVKEYKLGSQGFVDQKTKTEIGNWLPADYYVISSQKEEDGKYVLENKIINMKNGKIEKISIESQNQYSESSNNELAKKTEETIEKLVQ